MTERQHIDQWIQRLSVPNRQLGNMPVCPFAANTIYQLVHTDLTTLEVPVDEFSLVIYVLPDQLSQSEISDYCDHLNLKYPQLIFLPDYSQRYTHINGVQTNNGQLNLILCQPKDKLIKARQSLKSTGYYSYWSRDYLKEITGEEL
jgi:hypothetical protein